VFSLGSPSQFTKQPSADDKEIARPAYLAYSPP